MLRRALLISLCLHLCVLLWYFPGPGSAAGVSRSLLQVSVRSQSPGLKENNLASRDRPVRPAMRHPAAGERRQRSGAGLAGHGSARPAVPEEAALALSDEELSAYRLRLGRELRHRRAGLPGFQPWPGGRLIVRIEPAFPERLRLIQGEPAALAAMHDLIVGALRVVEVPAALQHAALDLVFEVGDE